MLILSYLQLICNKLGLFYMEFHNKTAIITGGSTGIGNAVVKKLIEHEVCVYNLDIQPSVNNESATYIPCDVSNYSDIKNAFEIITSSSPHIDFLFANAGVHLFANLEETTQEDLERVLGINFKGIYYALQLTIPLMKKARSGSIVLMSSDQAFIGKNDSSLYGATKGAIAQLTKSTAIDYAKFSIRCNCVCPGTIETPLYHNAVNLYSEKTGISKEDIYDNLKKAQPLNRIGQPEEVADAVLFLLSGQASFITGASLSIDGGGIIQ